MRAILLAGGKGTRISRFIKDVPKSLLPIGDKPLIRNTVETFINLDIDIVVCTGYRFDLIEEALKGLNVKFVYNPFYAVTNSLGTLWFAKDYLDDDVIVMNADVYFDIEILNKMIELPYDVVMACDSSRCAAGDYFFTTDEFGCIKKYGKEIPYEERTSEYVGMAKIKKNYLPLFNEQMKLMIENGEYDKWWENVIYSLADQNHDVKTYDFKGYFWSEIDFYDDYLRIVDHIENKIK